jgi:hypothetical protein
MRGNRGGCYAVLSGPGLGNDPVLAHPPGKQYLSYGIIYFMSTGVV